jgi:hypothetical protein
MQRRIGEHRIEFGQEGERTPVNLLHLEAPGWGHGKQLIA